MKLLRSNNVLHTNITYLNITEEIICDCPRFFIKCPVQQNEDATINPEHPGCKSDTALPETCIEHSDLLEIY